MTGGGATSLFAPGPESWWPSARPTSVESIAMSSNDAPSSGRGQDSLRLLHYVNKLREESEQSARALQVRPF